MMFQVTSFFCGCADLRKGTLIIGIIKLVTSLIRMAYAGSLLVAAATITTSVAVTSIEIGAGRSSGFSSANSMGKSSFGTDSFGTGRTSGLSNANSFGKNSFGDDFFGTGTGSFSDDCFVFGTCSKSAGRTSGFNSANSLGANSFGDDSFGAHSFGAGSVAADSFGAESFGTDKIGTGNSGSGTIGKQTGTGSNSNHLAVAVALPVIVTFLILGLELVILLSNVIVNGLLIQAAQNSKAEYTLPWLVINAISIGIGVLAFLAGDYTGLLNVPLSIYFWIVIKSYRTQLQGKPLVTV